MNDLKSKLPKMENLAESERSLDMDSCHFLEMMAGYLTYIFLLWGMKEATKYIFIYYNLFDILFLFKV